MGALAIHSSDEVLSRVQQRVEIPVYRSCKESDLPYILGPADDWRFSVSCVRNVYEFLGRFHLYMSMIGWLFLMFLWLVLVSVFYHFPVQRMMNHGPHSLRGGALDIVGLGGFDATSHFGCNIQYKSSATAAHGTGLGEKPGNPELLFKQFQSAQFSKR